MINRFQSLVLIYVLLLSPGCQSTKEEIECYCPSKITGVTSDTIVAQINVNKADSAFIQGSLSAQAKLPRIKKILEVNGEGGISGEYSFYDRVDSIIQVKNQPIDQRCITELDKISERCCNHYQIWRNDSFPQNIRSSALEKYLLIEDQYYSRLQECLGGDLQLNPDTIEDPIEVDEEGGMQSEKEKVNASEAFTTLTLRPDCDNRIRSLLSQIPSKTTRVVEIFFDHKLEEVAFSEGMYQLSKLTINAEINSKQLLIKEVPFTDPIYRGSQAQLQNTIKEIGCLEIKSNSKLINRKVSEYIRFRNL